MLGYVENVGSAGKNDRSVRSSIVKIDFFPLIKTRNTQGGPSQRVLCRKQQNTRNEFFYKEPNNRSHSAGHLTTTCACNTETETDKIIIIMMIIHKKKREENRTFTEIVC